MYGRGSTNEYTEKESNNINTGRLKNKTPPPPPSTNCDNLLNSQFFRYNPSTWSQSATRVLANEILCLLCFRHSQASQPPEWFYRFPQPAIPACWRSRRRFCIWRPIPSFCLIWNCITPKQGQYGSMYLKTKYRSRVGTWESCSWLWSDYYIWCVAIYCHSAAADYIV